MSAKATLLPSGHTFAVEAEETLLDAALRHGTPFPYGCRSGCCGACKGKLLSGEVDYHDNEPMALTEEEQEAGWVLPCIAQVQRDVTLEVKEIGAVDIPVKTMPAKIHKLERVSDEVMVVWLKLPQAQRLQYLAGQYLDIILPDGRHRAFSIANAPHDDQFLQLHVRYVRGGRFTEALFNDMHEREMLRIEAPHGSFYFREESDRSVIFLATGTGFGPVKAMIEHAIATGNIRPIYLYWGARSRKGLYMDELARGWAEEYENVHYIPVLSRPLPEDGWSGRVGYVQEVVAEDFDSFRNFEVYACGHPAMVYSAKEALMAKGLDPDYCYSDAFEFAKD